MEKNIWSEIRNDFEMDNMIHFDAWITPNDNESGKVIAKIDVHTLEVHYLDERAKTDSYAQEKIKEVLNTFNKNYGTNQEQLETLEQAMTAIMNLSHVDNVDHHFFIHGVNGVVDKLRSAINEKEELLNKESEQKEESFVLEVLEENPNLEILGSKEDSILARDKETKKAHFIYNVSEDMGFHFNLLCEVGQTYADWFRFMIKELNLELKEVETMDFYELLLDKK